MIDFLVTFLFKIIELFTPNFYEFKVYKKSDVCNKKTPNSHSNICVLMQGPLIEKKNFTFESLKWYKNCNPDISIIFSTWNSQNQNTIKRLRNLGIYVIENDLPKVKGVVNINLQIISTNSGLKFAEHKNFQYVLKTRSDQRIYEYKFIFSFFLNILKVFPIDENDNLKNRLIISSLNTYKNRLYGISDMFMFGRLCDMKLFWDISLQPQISIPIEINNFYYISYGLGEGAFVMDFFSKINFKPKWTSEDSALFYSKYFYVVDKESIGHFWYKYKRHDGFNYFYDEVKSIFFTRVNFSDWFNDYSNFK